MIKWNGHLMSSLWKIMGFLDKFKTQIWKRVFITGIKRIWNSLTFAWTVFS